jgi:sugar phosphate isomerase/epimerase
MRHSGSNTFSTSYILVDPLSSFAADDEFRRALEFLRETGYDGVEINIAEPPGMDLDRVEASAAHVGMAIPSLMTGPAYAEGLCLSSREASVRKQTVERLISYLETARRFDAVLVVGLLQGLRSDEPDPAIANERIVECFRELAPAAEEQGVQLVLEPVNHLQVGFNNSVKEVLATIERIGSPAVRPMVDTLHMNIEEHSPVQCVAEVGKDLRHVHLSESNGGLLGSGNAELAGVWQALKSVRYEHFVSVKIYRAPAWREAARSAMVYLDKLSRPDLEEDLVAARG